MIKTKLALGVTTTLLAFAAATVAPEVAAHESTKAHKHAKKAHVYETVETHSSSFSHSNSSNAKIDALEAQLQAMQAEIHSLRAASNHHQVDPDTAKVQELDQWMQSTKQHHEHHQSGKDNLMFFRGGYGYNENKRGGTLDPKNASGVGALNGAIDNNSSWYFGAGFDFGINDNLFGLMQNTDVLAELMFDYKQLGEKKPNGITPAIGAATGLPGVNNQTATVNSLSLAASPK